MADGATPKADGHQNFIVQPNNLLAKQRPPTTLLESKVMTSPSAEEITQAMKEAVASNDRLKKRFNATVSFEVDGAEPYFLDCSKNGSTNGDKPDLIVKTSLQTLQDLLAKKMTPQQAFMKGKLKIRGKMGLAMKLSLVLDATRKYLRAQSSRL